MVSMMFTGSLIAVVMRDRWFGAGLAALCTASKLLRQKAGQREECEPSAHNKFLMDRSNYGHVNREVKSETAATSGGKMCYNSAVNAAQSLLHPMCAST